MTATTGQRGVTPGGAGGTDAVGNVLATPGRLRRLLHANALVAGDLSLPVVLRQIVSAARDLLGARYAVLLGVLGGDGRLEQFVHDGIDDEQSMGTGGLCSGGGILGLAGQSASIGVADLSVHPVTAGFPPALAAAAGTAITNAWRFAESEQRHRWLDASALLTPLLLAEDQRRPHALITEHAAAAADADFALLALPSEPGQIIVADAAGPLAAELPNHLAPLADSLAWQAIRIGKPSLITGDRLVKAAAALGADIGPLIVVPLAAGGRTLGALILGRLAARPGFTESDLGMAVTFAGHTAVAMELAQARADQLLLAQAEDRDRIASDLHDRVIGELFVLGMKLQGHAARSDPATAERVNGYVDTLDEVIRNIRTSIFGLRAPHQPSAALQARVTKIIDEHAPQLGLTEAS
jgi:signal transduction histidine kinase